MEEKYFHINLDHQSAYPLANQLARRLIWMFADGEIKEGEVLPNIREFADALGIHMHTVRAAYHQLEDQDMVTIRPRVGTVFRQYIPFRFGEKKITLEKFIAVLVPSMGEIYNQIMKGIISVLEADALIPVVIPCREDPFYAEEVYKTLSVSDYAGVINISIGFSEEYYEVLRKQDDLEVPLVLVDTHKDFGHRIFLNTSKAIADITGHLISHNYKEIALINCPEEWPVGLEVAEGYRNSLADGGLKQNSSLEFTVPDFSFEAGRFCAERMLAELTYPRAVVAASDTLALGAISAFKAAGLRVPQDVAVCGYNDIPISAISDPPLTTVGLPYFAIGGESVHMVQRILKSNPKKWLNRSFDGEIQIRKSCGC